MKKHLFTAILLVSCGYFLAKIDFSVMTAYAQDRYADLQIFSKVLNLVQQYYVEEVDSKKLIYGAIKGMLRELDPHTNFLPPDIFKDFETETSGEFGGLGIEISVQNGILTIISPIEDTPAWDAGIKAGDKIIAVDGKSTKGLSLVEASTFMRGKRGTKTVLTIVREAIEEPFDVAITRGSVKIKSVKPTDMDEGYLYIKITSFIENTARDLEKAIQDRAIKNGNLKGIIIDLRRNPGGLLDQAVKVSDMFLADGIIVSTRGRDQKNAEVNSASKKGKYKDFPMIVLINEYSASASEIVAGALQDNHRAIIMGQRSFGKGSVQSVVKLGDGSGLKFTIARYYTPNGRSIQAEGIIPDLEVDEVDPEAFAKAVVKSKSTREKDIAGHLMSEKEKNAKKQKSINASDANLSAWWKESSLKKEDNMSPKEKLLATDYQVFQAYNYLKAWKIMKDIHSPEKPVKSIE
jgi:carboxyl-terminal processing protease